MKTFDYKIVDEHNIIVYLNGKEYEGSINPIFYFIRLKGQSFTFLFDELNIKNPKQYYKSILGRCIDIDCYSPTCKSHEELLKVLDKMKEDFPINSLIGKKVYLNQKIQINESYNSITMNDSMYEFLMSRSYYTIYKIDNEFYKFIEDSKKFWYPSNLFSFEETNINNQNSNNNEIKFQNPKASFTRGSIPTGHSIRCRTNKITITSGCLSYSKISFGS